MKLKTPSVALTTVALAVLAGASHAVPPSDPYTDKKSFPGATCQPQQGAQAQDINTYKDIIINTNPATRTVTCPIVRDNFVEGFHLGLAVFVASYGGKPLTCTFFSYGPTGELVQSRSESTSSTTPVALFRSPPSIDPPFAVQDGFYSVQCQLPQWGRVFSYVLGEIGGTDKDGSSSPPP